METHSFSDSESLVELVSQNSEDIEQLVARYEVTVFTLAMHLTGNEDAAKEVVIEVFIRLCHEQHQYPEEPLDSLIHRFTYDAALPRLIGQIENHLREVEEVSGQMSEELYGPIC